MEGAAVLPPGNFLLRLACGGAELRGRRESREGVELRIERGDARQDGVQELDGRQCASTDEIPRLGERELNGRPVGHGRGL